MRRLYFKILLLQLLFFATNVFQATGAIPFAQKSVLSNGTWYKIAVKESGICKLTYDQIKKMGFSNPSEIRVYGHGGALMSESFLDPYSDDLQEIPLYAGKDYFLFYAQGPIQWKYAQNRYDFSINHYSNYGYYFVTDNVGEKKRISLREPTSNDDYPSKEITSYMDFQMHKKEEINLANTGRCWYGDKFTQSYTKSFSFPDFSPEGDAMLYVKSTGFSNYPSTTDVTIRIGDSTQSSTLQHSLCSGHTMAQEAEEKFSCSPNNGKMSVTLKFKQNFSSDFATIERIIATMTRPLSMKSGTLFFRTPNKSGEKTNFKYIVENCTANTEIWDLSNHKCPQKVEATLSGSTLSFQDFCETPVREFVAVDVLSPLHITAQMIGKVENQNLHGEDASDLVIITHPNFMEGAEEIARLHEEYDEMTTLITTPEKIYNEFSSGTPDATALRYFLKSLYDKNGQKSFYLLLIGDGCFDNRGILASSSTTINNFMITYQSINSTDGTKSYVTDDYFAFLADSEVYTSNSKSKMCISVGRIPCSTSEQLDGYIQNKLKPHMENKSYGKWKNRIILMADDNESSTAYQRFCEYSDNLAKKVKTYNNSMEVKKVYFDAYTRTTGANGSRYHEVENLIKEELANGVMFFNYVGHSSNTGFSAEHVFTQTQAATMFNKNCGFWYTASCEFSQFDNLKQSGGEDLLLNPNGGAVALISSARVVFDTRNDNLNQSFFTHLFQRDSLGLPIRIGDAHRLSKQTLANDSNKLSFVLLGDPAIRLTYPSNYVTTDSIVSVEGEKTDTVRALSEMQVFGRITDPTNSTIEDFNGTMFVTLYDKEMTLYTKANIYTEEEDIIEKRHAYTDRPNILFSGQVEVENGRFCFSFKTPKDINYNYGAGRFSYYAYDETNGYEAQGNHENFIIGGSCDITNYETDGPIISSYLNSQNFRSGEKVNNNPVFYAIVSDENGINSSGAGIGHDITLSLNGSTTPVILNNYLTYDKNSYKSGVIKYQLNDLEEGDYTLTIKVWDLLNNSSSQTIHFTVDNEAEVEIEEFLAYPNPASESITLRVMHDRPETVQSFRFLLYNLSGTLLFQSDEVVSQDNGDLSLTWDLTTQNGKRIAPGCYAGRVEIKAKDDKYVGKSKKIIILPQ